ncbi:diguanylate cyclase [Polaromonas sp.]|uniref:diguanylate cyclase domain-containing protein n=1 Tax=Polaromonas sp. TaxID=1869339 RepID=UPI00185E26B7|nr:diguanylate cyclase [Polaromonas sp.]NMM05110.1 diguanylate cyclase [Polaromonas sp.]
MNTPADLDESHNSHNSQRVQVADAARELARIEQQTGEARADLARLLRELETAQTRQGQSQAARLLEANEQLVLATLNAQKAAEISQRALHEAVEAAQLDALTELPNRLLLRARLALAVAEAKQRGGRVALLLMEISNFKEIRDSMGAAVGDQVLMHATRCLTSAAGAQATVSRHGSVEFLILLPDVQQASEAVALAEKIVAALGAPARFNDHELRLSANVGISIYPEDSEQVDSLIDQAVAAMYRAKWQSPAGDSPGEKADSELTLAPLRKPVVQRYTALAEQALHQADMQEANTELLVSALGARQLVEAAERARRQQAVFLGILAHELRNPLAPLRNAAALLSRIPSVEPLLGQVQAIIERQLSTMSRLVGDLLDLSRASAGKLRIEKRPVDMAGLVDNVVRACRPGMDSRLQQFDLQLPPYRTEVDGDAVRLTQILTNLLDNASKYTPEGGMIGLSMQAEGDFLALTVVDNGIGITAETLPDIFEPFVQDAHATAFDKSGLGIGLTVVRDLVEAHGGQVEAKSDGKMLGSMFTVRLPLSSNILVTST